MDPKLIDKVEDELKAAWMLHGPDWSELARAAIQVVHEHGRAADGSRQGSEDCSRQERPQFSRSSPLSASARAYLKGRSAYLQQQSASAPQPSATPSEPPEGSD